MTTSKLLSDLIRDLLSTGDLEARVGNLNALRETIAQYSPFQSEPVDFVRWVKAEDVHANDYNGRDACKIGQPYIQL